MTDLITKTRGIRRTKITLLDPVSLETLQPQDAHSGKGLLVPTPEVAIKAKAREVADAILQSVPRNVRRTAGLTPAKLKKAAKRKKRVADAPEDRQAWLTPKDIIDKVLRALKQHRFSIDVASLGAGTSYVRADLHYTKDDPDGDGLARPWVGKWIWMNPPYADIGVWAAKARAAVEQGDAGIVVALLPGTITSAAWFHEHVVPHAKIIYLEKRQRFYVRKNVRSKGSPEFPSLLVVWGGTPEELERLGQEFETKSYGAILSEAKSPPKGDLENGHIELFAGVGAVRLGTEQAHFETLFANDFNRQKRESYEANFPRVRMDARDIRKLRARDLPSSVLMTASSPCQDHTTKGSRVGMEGKRGVLAFEVIRLVGELREEGRAPKLVVFENVMGLLDRGGRDFALLAQALVSVGYKIGSVVIDAEKFVPQSRERVFLIGVRQDVRIPEALVKARATAAWHPTSLRKAWRALPQSVRSVWHWFTLPNPEPRTTTLEDLLEEDACDWVEEKTMQRIVPWLTAKECRRIEKARRAGIKLGIVSGNKRDQRVLETRFDGVARCLTANEGGDNQQRIIVLDDSERGFRFRNFTPLERARLMALPPDFILPTLGKTGRVANGKMKRLAGDGVVVSAYAWLARHLLRPLADAPMNEAIEDTAVRALPVMRVRKEVDEKGNIIAKGNGIKAQTVGSMLYLPHVSHERVRARAKKEGFQYVSGFVLSILSSYFLDKEGLPLALHAPNKRMSTSRGRQQKSKAGDISIRANRKPTARLHTSRLYVGRHIPMQRSSKPSVLGCSACLFVPTHRSAWATAH